MSKDRIRIAVIGGGSVNWMKALMKDLYLLDEASGGEIRLMDPNLSDTRAVAAMLRKGNIAVSDDVSQTHTSWWPITNVRRREGPVLRSRRQRRVTRPPS